MRYYWMITLDMAIAIASLIGHCAPMPKKRETIDVMIDAHVWMRRREGARGASDSNGHQFAEFQGLVR
jgi:hypothetical protein